VSGSVSLANHTIDSIRAGLLAKQFSAEELVTGALAFAEAENPKTNAYLTLAPERALAAARAVDEKLAAGEDPGPLAGVPIGVKDVIVTRGLRTTCGSRLLANYVPPYDATAVIRLEQAGGVILGKNPPPRTRRLDRCATRWRWIGSRADRAVGRPQWWRKARRYFRSAPTPEAPSASRRPFAASPA
jgi:hypothetical protein